MSKPLRDTDGQPISHEQARTTLKRAGWLYEFGRGWYPLISKSQGHDRRVAFTLRDAWRNHVTLESVMYKPFRRAA